MSLKIIMKGAKNAIEKRVTFFCCVARETNKTNMHTIANSFNCSSGQECAGVPLIHCRVDKTSGPVHSNVKRREKAFCSVWPRNHPNWHELRLAFFFSVSLSVRRSRCGQQRALPDVFFFLLFQFYVTNLLMDKMWRAKHFKMWTILFCSRPNGTPTQALDSICVRTHTGAMHYLNRFQSAYT